jgi:hypothetical protein
MFLRASSWKNNEFGFILMAGQGKAQASSEEADDAEKTSSSGDYFVCNTTVATRLIDLLLDCLNSTEVGTTLLDRVADLRQRLVEAQWRAQFILSTPFLKSVTEATTGHTVRI